MAILRCKMCGGEVNISEDKTFGTCDSCGNAMTFPKVSDEQRAAAFNRGNHFRRIGEFDKALAVYERIVQEDETDAEAHWCCALCRFGIEYVEDPSTMEWIPTCHRASYDSFLDDVDYQAALEHSDGVTRRQYQKDAAKIAEVQKGILAASQGAEAYDVFICYKESDEMGQRTRDSLLAQDIYYQLTEQGRKVFFARITLENMAGKQYEPYIFSALNSAKVMVVVGTKAEYLNAVWVKNEWSRFLAMMKKDHSKLLLPCYRDMDPYDMPEQLSVLQSYDMSKIGFIQDLIRGIAKVLDVNKPAVAATMVAPSVANNVSTLVKRGTMALEDAEWSKADDFFEEALNQDAECTAAYLGKLLCAKRVRQGPELAGLRKSFRDNPNYKRAYRFATPEQQQALESWLQSAEENERKDAEEAARRRAEEAERARLEKQRRLEEEERAREAARQEQLRKEAERKARIEAEYQLEVSKRKGRMRFNWILLIIMLVLTVPMTIYICCTGDTKVNNFISDVDLEVFASAAGYLCAASVLLGGLCLMCSGFGKGINILFAVLTRIVAIPMAFVYMVMAFVVYTETTYTESISTSFEFPSTYWEAAAKEATIWFLLCFAVEFLILLILPFRKKIVKLRG